MLANDKLNKARGGLARLDEPHPLATANHEDDDRGFLELQACIPHLAETSRRVSRLDILLEAINYIDVLHTTLLDKIQRGEMNGEERRKLIASYLNNMVADGNKENGRERMRRNNGGGVGGYYRCKQRRQRCCFSVLKLKL